MTTASSGGNRKPDFWIAGVILVVSGFFLFYQLGHYALWDDEAMTGLFAKSILKTGDTLAVLDHNIIAYSDGLHLRNMRERTIPPFPAFATAISFVLCGEKAWAARLPFALSGFACVALMLWWALKEKAQRSTLFLLGIAIIGNVSLFLFCRQSRYYGSAIFCSTAIAYLYLNWKSQRSRLLWMALFSVVLLASNYMEFVALSVCIALDYIFWQRKKRPLTKSDWLLLLVPQIILGGWIGLIWNPTATGYNVNAVANTLGDRIKSIPAFLRDLNVCEFGIVFLLLVAPLLYFRRRNVWLLRVPLALLLYTAGIALLCPFKAAGITEGLSQIRYLCPSIPLWIALGVLVVNEIAGTRRWLVYPLGVLFFWFNLVSANWLIPFRYLEIKPRSTLFAYVEELLTPPSDPFTTMSNWINANIEPGKSVWVRPNFATYPLMFHAPQVTYAWQLPASPKEEYAALPMIHFAGKEAPDYMIGFHTGGKDDIVDMAGQMRNFGYSYRPLPPLNCFGKDVHRPELFLRSFKPITNFDLQSQAIYILERVADATPQTPPAN